MGLSTLKRNMWRRIFDGVEERKRHHYDRMEARKAARFEAHILKQRPENQVTSKIERLIRDYAGDMLGGQRFAPWLRTYATSHGEFREGWLPNNFFGHVIRPRFGPTGTLADAKSMARRLMRTDLLPDLVSRVRGCWRDRDGVPITSDEAREIAFDGRDQVVIKHDNSQNARDVTTVDAAEFDTAVAATDVDFVVQERLRHDPFYDKWNTEAVTTLRMITFKPYGEPARLRWADMRISKSGKDVVLVSNSYRCPIDIWTGHLRGFGFDPNMHRFEVHADTGEPFGTDPVPAFAAMRSQLEALHDRLPHPPMIAWDMITDHTGQPKMMEWNTGHIGVVFPESMAGPILPELSDKNWQMTGTATH